MTAPEGPVKRAQKKLMAARLKQPPTDQNWAIGCVAGSHSGNGYGESVGHPVQPASLYLAQLKDRLGK